jgi:aspartate oxidase
VEREKGSIQLAPVQDLTYDPLSAEDEGILRRSADLYYSNLTIIRAKAGLQEVLQFADGHRRNRNTIIRNRLTLGSILATAALTREESRGTHYREDFPERNPVWNKRIVLSIHQNGGPKVEFLP